MPRPNRTRAVYAEDHLAQRIAAERTARGWTIDGLAKRMTDAGCNMTGSAIFKIEKGEPRRRIVVDELVTFSQVLGIPVDQLLLPPEIARKAEVTQLVMAWHSATIDHEHTLRNLDESRRALSAYVDGHPDVAADLGGILAEWAVAAFDEEHREFQVAYQMWSLTRSPEWKAKVVGLMQEAIDDAPANQDGE
jgi:transcriptional regulator with XRE-family HTH domain